MARLGGGTNERTVGAEIEIKHMAPTPLGQSVTIITRVIGSEGKAIDFQFEVRDEHVIIARGLHKRGVINFASSDYCGMISEGYDKLLKIIASDAYPGDFGSIDVDGLRSLCVSRLRVAVGAGIWRANHKTFGAWAERAYPERHRINDNDKN